MQRRLTALAAALFLAAPPAAARAQPTTLDFERVGLSASGFNSQPFTENRNFQFENWGVLGSGAAFGTGVNASSGSNFLYAFALAGASYIYRSDVGFHLYGASLSFRAFDENTDPADLTIRAYRGADEVFTRTLSLTNSAQRFRFDIRNVDEVAFETGALDGTRSAVLAVDDITIAAVPEPATVALVASGLAVLVGVARRRGAPKA